MLKTTTTTKTNKVLEGQVGTTQSMISKIVRDNNDLARQQLMETKVKTSHTSKKQSTQVINKLLTYNEEEALQHVNQTKEERFAKTFSAIDKMLENKDVRGYAGAINSVMVNSVIKELVGHNFSIDYKIMEEFKAECSAWLYTHLATWHMLPYAIKRNKSNADKKDKLTKRLGKFYVKTTNEEGTEETTYQYWYEIPNRLLWSVLKRRAFTAMRSYLVKQGNLNRMIELENIAGGQDNEGESNLESTIFTKLECRASQLDMSVPEVIDYLKHTLSPTEYNALVKWVKDGTQKGIRGGHIQSLRDKINSGVITPDELYKALPKLRKIEHTNRVEVASIIKKLG